MNKTVVYALIAMLALTGSALAEGVGSNPVFAKTIDGKSIQVFKDAEAYSVVASAVEACAKRGDHYCPSWGGPNIPLTPGGTVTGADYSAVIRTQEAAYKAAKEQANGTQAQADWEVVAGLALRTSVESSVYNRIARNIRDSATTQGKLRSKSAEAGHVVGTAKIDREALKSAKEWYAKAEAAGKSASVMQQENSDKTTENQSLATDQADQATKNILRIDATLTSDRFDVDGNHIYRLSE